MGEEETGITWLMYSFPANSLLPLTTSRTNSGNVKWKEASLLEELWNLFHTLEGRLLHWVKRKKVGSGLVEYQDMRILTLQYICLVHEDIRPKQRLGAKLLFRLHKRLPFGSQMNIQSSQDQDL